MVANYVRNVRLALVMTAYALLVPKSIIAQNVNMRNASHVDLGLESKMVIVFHVQ